MKKITITMNGNKLPTPAEIKSAPAAKPRFTPIKITSATSQNKKKKIPIVKIIVLLIVAGILGTGIYLVIKAGGILQAINIQANPSDIFGTIITPEEPELEKDENGLTNALLVGIDTRPTDWGLMNTDTIMIVSFNHNTNAATMLSIPRDTYAENPRYPGYFTKINAIYAGCEIETPGEGMTCLAEAVEVITGLHIHYYGMVDIAGLINVVDMLGGVDIYVENAFTDYMFPMLDDSDYMTVEFEQGLQHMDGVTAMQYARSRHAQSVEGSDYARARRQQKVIAAMKEKALSLGILSNPIKVLEIIEELGSSIRTSGLTTNDIRAAINLASKVEESNTFTMVLDPMAGNWSLIESQSDGGFILVPQAGVGNWDNVRTFVSYYINYPAVCTENAWVYVYNGGIGYDAAYAQYEQLLATYPYLPITYGGDYPGVTVEGTYVLNFADPAKSGTVASLIELLGEDTSTVLPAGVSNPNGEDVMILLGAPITQTAPEEIPAEGTQQ